LPALPSANANSYEAEIFSLVNGGRSSKLTSDPGLQAAARAHSRNMAQSGNLSHGGAASRIGNAAPAGYTGTYCENLGYASSNQDVARTIYNGWRNSSGHNACMHDTRMNVAGVGTYKEGDIWWVTMEFAQVRGSSGSNNPPPAAPISTPKPQAQETPRPQAAASVADEPKDTPKETPSPTPKPTATPEPEESRNDVQAFSEVNTSVPPDEPMLGTREYASLGALIAFAGLVFFLARRRV
jgi:hypothetical protein